MTALLISYITSKKWDLGLTVNGFLAGLVAITAGCYWVEPVGAFFIGLVAGIVVYAATELLEYLRIDDPIGAVPVHLANGIWGTLAIGLFASGAYGLPTPNGADTTTVVTGLFYGGGTGQLVAQFIGSASTVVVAFVAAYAIMWIIEAVTDLRLSPDKEIAGLDLYEHGTSAYPEYVLNGEDGTPKTMEEAKKVLVRSSSPAAGD